jgi:hypothetical protein
MEQYLHSLYRSTSYHYARVDDMQIVIYGGLPKQSHGMTMVVWEYNSSACVYNWQKITGIVHCLFDSYTSTKCTDHKR